MLKLEGFVYGGWWMRGQISGLAHLVAGRRFLMPHHHDSRESRYCLESTSFLALFTLSWQGPLLGHIGTLRPLTKNNGLGVNTMDYCNSF